MDIKRRFSQKRKKNSRLHREIRVGIDTGGTFTDFIVADGNQLFAFKLPSTPHNPAEAILRGVGVAVSGSSSGPSTDESALAVDAAGPSVLRDHDSIVGEQLAGGDRFTGLGRLPGEVVHGTTVATNALLERKGARTALITTLGFEDVIEIGRQARRELYNPMVTRPAPLVPADLRFGVDERTLPDGSILTPLNKTELHELRTKIASLDVESIAVCLLFSFSNPAHELQIGECIKTLNLPVSLSHEILPEYREYERTTTTVINAYLAPLMSRYLRSLIEGLEGFRVPLREGDKPGKTAVRSRPESGVANLAAGVMKDEPPNQNNRISLRVMQSNGGSVSAESAAAEPVRAILSGPAGGVVGALAVAGLSGIHDIITFDMGGTSTDVALCRGEARTTNEATVAGLPVSVPIIDIHTVGAGGGSIGRLDVAGALRVGPESAGADPGPACYGRGEEVTVTDANLVLGRFGRASLLGGDMPLDTDRARRFLGVLAGKMAQFSGRPVSCERAALGVISVANANMEKALRAVSVERGQDPRLFTLVSFGGAGGLHVVELAAALRIPQVMIPRSPGTLSALGVLLGDVVLDYSRTIMMKAATLDLKAIEREFTALETTAKQDLAAEGFRGARAKLARSAAIRYVGQSFEIDIPWGRDFQARFHSAHNERYGYSDPARPTEIVSVRVRASGITDKPEFQRSRQRKPSRPRPAYIAQVSFGARKTPTPVYRREDLEPGSKFAGPAIVTEYSSTTLIPAGHRAQVDAWHNIIISKT
jgi:N-methylhydantoinase A